MDRYPLSQMEAWEAQMGVINAALEILMKKRVAYSGTEDPFRNFRTAEAVSNGVVTPEISVMVRLGDKIARLWNAVTADPESVNNVESVMTSDIPDIINYVCILAGLLSEHVEPTAPMNTGDAVINTIKEVQQKLYHFDPLKGKGLTA